MLTQSINHYITYSVITAQPELPYSSVLSTIRCYAVTGGELEGSTFIEWTGNFSSDADASKLRLMNLIQRSSRTDNMTRCDPRRQVQAPRGSCGSVEGCNPEVNAWNDLTMYDTHKSSQDAAVAQP